MFHHFSPDEMKKKSLIGLQQGARRVPWTSKEDPPYCRVHRGFLDLYVNQCAEWWVFIPLKQQLDRQQVVCTPYVPEFIGRGQEIDIRLHVHADNPWIETVSKISNQFDLILCLKRKRSLWLLLKKTLTFEICRYILIIGWLHNFMLKWSLKG